MTQQDLDALKALAAKATPGPWEEVAESGEWWVTSTSDEAGALYVIPDTTSMAQDDVDYICAACNAVPALVADVERLTAQVAELERELAVVRYSYAAAYDNYHATGKGHILSFDEWWATPHCPMCGQVELDRGVGEDGVERWECSERDGCGHSWPVAAP
jgi:hypothetical protein